MKSNDLAFAAFTPDNPYLSKGLTARDYIAIEVFKALIGKTPLVDQESALGNPVEDKHKYNSDLAESAYWLTDALIVASQKVLV